MSSKDQVGGAGRGGVGETGELALVTFRSWLETAGV